MMGLTAPVKFDAETQKNLDLWLKGHYDEATKSEIRKLLSENPQEIVDAFYTTLSFGTGGMRGVMGVGSNRMNKYTIGAATQGLANYINQQPKPPRGYSVLIGYDSRNNSRSFAEECAKILAANGIKVYLFRELRPVPLVSFGVRLKKCTAGIMITASHNPPKYNGYKVYWNDGAQVLPPHDKNIVAEVNKIIDVNLIKAAPSLKDPLIEEIDKEVDEAYVETISHLQNYPEENRRHGPELKIVYTSLHGTGITMMPSTLDKWGFTNLHFVEKQIIPDGNFPTTPSPNPEELAALALGIKTLKDSLGDILIATDPDADRVGVATNYDGKIDHFNGNQIACIILEHICEALTKNNKMPANAAFIKTIVTSELFKAIAESYGKTCFNVLTGFKYIAEKIREWEQDPKGYQYIFGGEESYGYLMGTQTRDKDAILSGALLCEVALHAKRQNKTLLDLLHDLYRKHGVYYESLLSMNFEESKAGKEQMARGMNKLQHSPPQTLNGINVVAIEDYHKSIKTILKGNKTEPITLPKSDVLLFWFEDNTKLVIRPSGTEPKIKIYCGATEKTFKSVPQALADCEKKANALVNALQEIMKA